MNTGDEEQVFISALRAGDVVRHPETLEWMVIVDLEEGVFTRKEFNQGEDTRVVREPYRSMRLDRLDRPAYETWFPTELYYRDIERMITRKKRRTTD